MRINSLSGFFNGFICSGAGACTVSPGSLQHRHNPPGIPNANPNRMLVNYRLGWVQDKITVLLALLWTKRGHWLSLLMSQYSFFLFAERPARGLQHCLYPLWSYQGMG